MYNIKVLDGSLVGREFPLKSDILVIGRDETCEISIPGDGSISRRHASIKNEYGKVVLEDLGSTNGTYLVSSEGEEEEIIHTILNEGMIFRVGKTNLCLLSPPREVDIETGTGEIEVIESGARDFSIHTSIDPNEIYTSSNFVSVPEDQKEVDELNRKIRIFYDIGLAMGKMLDPEIILKRIVDKVLEMFPAQRGYLMLLNKETNELETKVIRRKGVVGTSAMSGKIEVSKTIINQVIKEKRAILSGDARMDERFGMPDSVFLHDIRATIYAPMMLEHRVLGILCIDSSTSSKIFTNNDLKLLSVIANQAAQAIENANLHQKLRLLFLSTIKALANAIEARDVYTRGHSDRVHAYTVKLAQNLNIDGEEIEHIRYAALLHDIGKINIKEDILNKPGRLTKEEFDIMKLHPVYGARIMEPVKEFERILPYVYHHHERYDGGGYPAGLKGEDIPLASRILAVADSFDAMTSNRPYREALSLDHAVKELEENSGTQFDPRIAKTFLAVIKNEGPWLKRAMSEEGENKSEGSSVLDLERRSSSEIKKESKEKSGNLTIHSTREELNKSDS